MITESDKRDLKNLRKELTIHNYLYYHLAEPIIPDAIWDQMFASLKRMELHFEMHEQLEPPEDSPTQTVGWDPNRPDPRKYYYGDIHD